MIEILPIRLLTEEDSLIFGSLNVALGKLARLDIPVAPGIVITPPHLKLKTALEHFDFGKKEIFQQTLVLVKKEIYSVPIPEILAKETGKHKMFLLEGKKIKGIKALWEALLDSWIEQLKTRLWEEGFHTGITDNLGAKAAFFIKNPECLVSSYEDNLQDDVYVNTKSGKAHPMDIKKIVELTELANKKLFIPNQYEWITDGGVKLVGIKPYTPSPEVIASGVTSSLPATPDSQSSKSQSAAVKVFFDLSAGLTIEKDVDGIYISSEKLFDLNRPHESFDKLIFQLVESAISFPDAPVLLKLADMSEGMGKIRGTLRLLHQQSLLNPLLDVLDFARHKKSLQNVHIVIPFVRGVSELFKIKRELVTKKLMRKASLQYFMEAAIPENIINLEDYLLAGIDGIVLNLDELIAHLNGFDPAEAELSGYKNEVEGLIRFLDDGIRLLHKSKIPFIAYGSLSLYPKVLEFLVEKGVYGIVAERYEAHSAKNLLHQVEKRIILRKT
jgi:hypothetical protein